MNPCSRIKALLVRENLYVHWDFRVWACRSLGQSSGARQEGGTGRALPRLRLARGPSAFRPGGNYPDTGGIASVRPNAFSRGTSRSAFKSTSFNDMLLLIVHAKSPQIRRSRPGRITPQLYHRGEPGGTSTHMTRTGDRGVNRERRVPGDTRGH